MTGYGFLSVKFISEPVSQVSHWFFKMLVQQGGGGYNYDPVRNVDCYRLQWVLRQKVFLQNHGYQSKVDQVHRIGDERYVANGFAK